jgi:hypothetical protein
MNSLVPTNLDACFSILVRKFVIPPYRSKSKNIILLESIERSAFGVLTKILDEIPFAIVKSFNICAFLAYS